MLGNNPISNESVGGGPSYWAAAYTNLLSVTAGSVTRLKRTAKKIAKATSTAVVKIRRQIRFVRKVVSVTVRSIKRIAFRKLTVQSAAIASRVREIAKHFNVTVAESAFVRRGLKFRQITSSGSSVNRVNRVGKFAKAVSTAVKTLSLVRFRLRNLKATAVSIARRARGVFKILKRVATGAPNVKRKLGRKFFASASHVAVLGQIKVFRILRLVAATGLANMRKNYALKRKAIAATVRRIKRGLSLKRKAIAGSAAKRVILLLRNLRAVATGLAARTVNFKRLRRAVSVGVAKRGRALAKKFKAVTIGRAAVVRRITHSMKTLLSTAQFMTLSRSNRITLSVSAFTARFMRRNYAKKMKVAAILLPKVQKRSGFKLRSVAHNVAKLVKRFPKTARTLSTGLAKRLRRVTRGLRASAFTLAFRPFTSIKRSFKAIALHTASLVALRGHFLRSVSGALTRLAKAYVAFFGKATKANTIKPNNRIRSFKIRRPK